VKVLGTVLVDVRFELHGFGKIVQPPHGGDVLEIPHLIFSQKGYPRVQNESVRRDIPV
jgi:hypothetical protein